MILVDKLDDTDFPTFPQFQAMLLEYERCYPERPTVARGLADVVASTVHVSRALPMSQRWYDSTSRHEATVAQFVPASGLSVWPDGVTRCSHGVAIELGCHDCRLQQPEAGA